MTSEQALDPIHPGQFRLSRIQLINWGTFHGTVDIPVTREGILVTGGSGSGKSTLIDAITAVLLPQGKLRFNSAAQANTPRNKGRSLVTYIRGAWRAQEDPLQDQIVSTYLRPRATYSLVGLTYSNGEGVEHTLVAIFYLKSGHNLTSDISSYYGVFPVDQDINALLDFLKEGIDKRQIRAAFKEAIFSEQHSVFSGRFRSRLGISSEEALLLLHRAQSAKDLQSLDDLFRDYMLVEPDTFSIAKTAVEQFQDLEGAYEQVEDIKRQIHTLDPLVQLKNRREKAQQSKDHANALKKALPTVGNRIKKEEQETLVRQFTVEQTQAKSKVESAKIETDRAREMETLAHDNIKQIVGAQHGILSAKREGAVDKRRTISTARAGLDALVKGLGGAAPESAEELLELNNAARLTVDEYPAAREALESAGQRNVEDRTRAVDEFKAADQELSSLSKGSSNIEYRLLQVRENLCQDLGVSPRDMPFAGELIDPNNAEWEPVVQRILGGFAAEMLVPHGLLPRVRDWVNAKHLAALLKFNGVVTTGEYKTSRFPADSLIRKVDVVESPFRDWVNQELGKRFNIRCVRTPEELSALGPRDQGVTILGVRKFAQQTGDPTTRWEKDDRRKLGDRSTYRLGSTNDAKVETLRETVKAGKAVVQAADNRIAANRAELRELERQYKDSQDILKVSWAQIDVESADAAIAELDRLLEELNNTPEATELSARHEAAKQTLARVSDLLVAAQSEETVASMNLKRAETELKRLESLPVTEVSEEIAREVEKLFLANTRRVHAANVDEQTIALREDLDKQIDANEAELRRCENQIVGILRSYIETWPANRADLQAEPEFVGEAINRLGELRSDRLAEFTAKFLGLMNEMSTRNLGQISRRLRDARREIEERIEPINASLAQSEFNEGRFLHIDIRDQSGPIVREFQQKLDAATSGDLGTSTEKQAFARYALIAEIISKLASHDSADARWRNTVLDTRRHVRFIGLERDSDGATVNTYVDSASLSGGQAQKLVFFCLAAALRYQLAEPGAHYPTYATVILDEAFDRADPAFTRQTMNVFHSFGFHMVLATPLKLIQTLGDYVGSTIVVSYTEKPNAQGAIQGNSSFSRIEK
ncbi:ATP-binding protein [Corynebacterium glutamicum]|uniref:ATP-binding protein n=1 Tax=Corynebacterium glutamicum TaxID=1718 RepID=UPI00117FFBBF|nr:ATP-binding protein [Corynebacterium glutamicum]QDQ19370.1 AAA family ATPase [Corynebacterium glutamicum]QDQ22934.1 AAA family ATPase [Corynebacterium glutamicum]